MRFTLFVLLSTISIASFSQKVFFKSEIPFTEKQLAPFYSSVALIDEKIFFQSNDFRTYAFDRKTNEVSWEVYTGFKSDVPPVVANENVLISGESYSLIVDRHRTLS
jgi:outer membrane protein assembly factor BamB